MKTDLLGFEETPAPIVPAWVSRESQLQGLMQALSPYFDLAPSSYDEEEYDPDCYPELCHSGVPIKNGTPFTIWIYFKDNLSVSVATLYFESVNMEYVLDMIHTFYAYYSHAIDLIEVDELNTKWSQAIRDISIKSH